jgi:hypothetical protein
MRPIRPRYLLTGMIAVLWLVPSANADTVGFVKSPLVDHPVHHPAEGRSAHRWRSSVGSWGENFAEQTLRSRGFDEIHEIKAGGNQGIDRVAIKRGPDGAIKNVKFVEVKTTRSSKPRLNRTKSSGTQMSRKYVADNLKKMRNSGDPALKKLAVEIGRFRRSSGVQVPKLGEVIHISTKSGLATTFSGDLKTVQSVVSVERQLKQIRRRAGSADVRRWTVRSLAAWDQIRSQSMTTYLGKDVAQRSKNAILANAAKSTATVEAAALRQSRSALTKKILVRAAGPIATVVSLAVDAKEFFDTEYAYRNGAISERQRNVSHLTKLAGTAGALAMAPVGAATGAWLGAFGGPFAWVTVPAGGLVGGTLFGIVGYFGGSTIAEYGTTAWYGSIDASVREKFERYWLATPNPFH